MSLLRHVFEQALLFARVCLGPLGQRLPPNRSSSTWAGGLVPALVPRKMVGVGDMMGGGGEIK